MSVTPIPDIDALKARIKATWTGGDFGVIAHQIEKSNQEVVDSLGIRPGLKVLDIACGTGNSAIPLARQGAEVIGVDIAPNLLEQARTRAREAGVEIRFEEGDVEQLAFPDASFDLLISIFGAMFAPRPELAVSEMKRVVRPGGRIVMANWTASGFLARSFKLNMKYAPPPPGMAPPLLWGDPAVVRERFREGFSKVEITPRSAVFRYPYGVRETVENQITYSPPTLRTFQSLDAEGQSAFRREMEELYAAGNEASDGTVLLTSEFLQVVATRT
jgi:ubiquinone/menaquinone biosynthesis C-methylase UbiE